MNRRCLNCMNEFSIPVGGEHISYRCPYCMHLEGTPQDEAYHLPKGTVLADRYVIGTVIGFGGFGVTYKAWDSMLMIVVAIKEYFPSNLVKRMPGHKSIIVYDGNKRVEYYEGLNRFLEEARNMARFEDNPNIVHVDNFFKENETAYIVMEFLDGMNVKKYLMQAGGKLGWQEATDIILGALDGIEALHKEGILHRDISPDNIFVCKDGVKLIDFGAARFSDEERAVTRSIILKIGFAPPEQYVKKSKQGPWTDFYALAATMYKMVTGIMPDESVNRAKQDDVVPPSEIDSTIPEYISNGIMKGMALQSELRYKNVEQFRRALQNKLEVKDVASEIKSRKKRRLIGITIMAAIIIMAGTIAFGLYKSKKSQVVLEEARITIWLCIDEGEEADGEKQMILDMSRTYLENQPAITLNIECIPADEYEERLEKALNTDSMPVLYESDNVNQTILDNSVDMGGVFEYLEYGQDEYYFLDDYKEELSQGNQLPLGFCVPVIYVRRGNNSGFESLQVSSFSQIADQGNGYYLMPEYYEMYAGTFDGENINRDSVAAGYGERDTAIDRFVDGDITYYLASTNEYRLFNERAAGLYEMRPISKDVICGEFTNLWSIDKGASRDEINAANMLLSYMLAEGPQKTMHIANKNAIPLNKGAYEQFVANNGKYSILNDYLERGDTNVKATVYGMHEGIWN